MLGSRPSHFRSEKKKRKQIEHAEREAHWQRMPPELQQVELDVRFGTNQGATKQRARIRKALGDPELTR